MHSVIFYAVTALTVSLPFLGISAALTRGVELPLVESLGAIVGGVVFYGVYEGRSVSRKRSVTTGRNGSAD